jgi:putative ABC transport system permease protein
MRVPAFIESLISDAVHGIRLMRRNLVFSTTIILTLATGIGATTAVFTVANAVLLQPVPIPAPERAVVLQSTSPREGTRFQVAEGVFMDWRSRARSIDRMAGCWNTSMIMSGAGQPHQVNVVKATADFFEIAGLRPIAGRLFDAGAEQPGMDNTALLDAGFWQREFGGRTDVLGRQITLDDRSYTVIGVLPSGFSLGYLRRMDVWVPFSPHRDFRTGGAVIVIGQLGAGVSQSAAQAEMNVIHAGIGREHREDSPFGVHVGSLHDWLVSEAKPALLALCGAVALLLILCSVNIANLLLARGGSRRQEFAIRASLGGSRGRLTRQALVENVVLAIAGGIAGWFVAANLVGLLPRIKGFYLPRIDEIQIDGRMLLIAIAVTAGAALLFGLAPAWRSSRHGIREALGSWVTPDTGLRTEIRARYLLVVAQLALSLILLCGAGLLFNSFIRLITVNVGFSDKNVLDIAVRLPHKQYTEERSLLFTRRLMSEIESLPGVQRVSAADHLPLQAVRHPYALKPEGQNTAPIETNARHIERHYFEVLGIPLLQGREFFPGDDARTPIPVILNSEAARRLFGEGRAIGRSIRTNYKSRPLLEVIGIAASVRQLGLKQNAGPQMYLPIKYGSGRHVIAQVAPNAGDLTAAIRDKVFSLDPAVPAPEVSGLNTMFEYEIAKPRFYLVLLGAFAVMGLILAAIGIYGVVAFSVIQRTHEFGVRMALGAEREDILKLVFGAASWLIVMGVAIGVGGGYATTRLLSTMLYGVRPDDGPTFTIACLLLAAVALAACYLPARKAAGLHPMAALRHE